MHAWSEAINGGSSNQKRRRLLELASGSAAAGQQADAGPQQQPKKRVTGSISRLGMPSSGGSLPTSGACTTNAALLLMPKQLAAASSRQQPQQQGGDDPDRPVQPAPLLASRISSSGDPRQPLAVIAGAANSMHHHQGGRVALRSNPFSTSALDYLPRQQAQEEDDDDDCLQGFSLLPTSISKIAAAQPVHRRGSGIISGSTHSTAAAGAKLPPSGRPPTAAAGRQGASSSVIGSSSFPRQLRPADSSYSDAAPRASSSEVLDLQRAAAFCAGLSSPQVTAALSRLAHIDYLPAVCGTPHAAAGRDPLQVTAAALYLLLERAKASPAEARSPRFLLCSLWVLESYSSQYRCSALVVLRDYTCYTDVEVPQEQQLEPKQWLPHLLALQPQLLARADWRLRITEEELAAVCSAFVHGRQDLRLAFAAALHGIKAQVKDRQVGRTRRRAQAEEGARRAVAAERGLQLHMGQLQLCGAAHQQQQAAAGGGSREMARLKLGGLDGGYWRG